MEETNWIIKRREKKMVNKEKREKEKRSNDGVIDLEKKMMDGRTLRLEQWERNKEEKELFFFFREFQRMASTLSDISLSLN